MKPLSTLTFCHEDISQYAAEAADAIDVLETKIGDLVAVEKLALESGLTLTEKEALHLVVLSKKAEDLFNKNENESPYESSGIGILLDKAIASVETTKETLVALDGFREYNGEALRSAVMELDLSSLPADVVADVSLQTVSALHDFHLTRLKSFIQEMVEFVKADPFDRPHQLPELTISILGQYCITSNGNALEPFFIDELSSMKSAAAGNENDSVKALLADIVCTPMPMPKAQLDVYLSTIADTLREIKQCRDQEGLDLNTLNQTTYFSLMILSAIRCWAFIYGTTYNTLVRLS